MNSLRPAPIVAAAALSLALFAAQPAAAAPGPGAWSTADCPGGPPLLNIDPKGPLGVPLFAAADAEVKGDLAGSEADLRKAIAVAGQRVAVPTNEALEQQREAIALADLRLASLLIDESRFDEAQALLTTLAADLEAHPDVPALARGWTALHLGRIHAERRELDRAVAEFDRADTCFTKLANPQGLVELWLDRAPALPDDDPRALDGLQRAVKVNPNLPRAHDAIALLKARHKDLDGAAAELKIAQDQRRARLGDAVMISPDYAEGLVDLSIVDIDRGDPQHAALPARQALAIYRHAYGEKNVRTAEAELDLAVLLEQLAKKQLPDVAQTIRGETHQLYAQGNATMAALFGPTSPRALAARKTWALIGHEGETDPADPTVPVTEGAGAQASTEAQTQAREAARDAAIEAQYTADFTACEKASPATSVHVKCLNAEEERQNARFDAAYKARLAALTGPARDAFAAEQKAKTEAARAGCAPYFKRRGSGNLLGGMRCDLDTTIERRLDLEEAGR
jgi:tetratricopeptide (TPR) repeat protein/uncharacterized protein YecT (DUF1311 family)